MLVCSVVLRSRHSTFAATVSETAFAIDAPTSGTIFAILADDPGAASDTLNGFVGQMMVEAASAAAVVNAGSIRTAAIVEAANALTTVWSPSAYAVSVAEPTTAGSTPDASIIPPGIFAAAIVETATAISTQDALGATVVYSAVLDGAFVDPRSPATVIGTDVLGSGPITVFEP